MANELKATGTPTNGTMSAFLILSSNGYLWDTNAGAFAETPTAANAAITLTEAGSTGRMVGDIPAAALTAAAGYDIKVEYIDVVPGSVAFTDTVAEREVIKVDTGGSIITGITTAVDQQPVPASRTAMVVAMPGVGNVGECSITLSVGELQTIAVDFRKIMPTNGRITTATFTQLTQPVGGDLAIGTVGQDKALAKAPLTPDTAGAYTIEVIVTYADGGGQAAATVTVYVV